MSVDLTVVIEPGTLEDGEATGIGRWIENTKNKLRAAYSCVGPVARVVQRPRCERKRLFSVVWARIGGYKLL